jgi:hypothetical protein
MQTTQKVIFGKGPAHEFDHLAEAVHGRNEQDISTFFVYCIPENPHALRRRAGSHVHEVTQTPQHLHVPASPRRQ